MDSRFVGGKLLRRGYTTGTCAAAAAKAAVTMLLTQSLLGNVSLTMPDGTQLTLDIIDAAVTAEGASCAVKKDSGDDPDVTNGALIYAHASLADEGVAISGGEGIGRVTKPGLDQPVGEYAINSAPRKMIKEECESVFAEHGYMGGAAVVISIPGGLSLAEKTFNPRLGIKGGLSILGTTGIVEPMSDTAIVKTIRAELSILYKEGKRDVLLTIGNYGEAFARNMLRLNMRTQVKCSNFIGETLSAAVEIGFSRALIIGHVGKLAKLGIRITNTHSSYGDGRAETLIACALEAGAPLTVLHNLRRCVSSEAMCGQLLEAGLLEEVMSILSDRIEDTLARLVGGHLEVGFISFYGTGDKAALCAQNELARKMPEVFSV